MQRNDLLVMIPTYNEAQNAPKIFHEINALDLSVDVLFIDDNSPDGTADEIQKLQAKHPNLFLKRRSGKLGIGSAHLDGISYAYENGYKTLVTMDCDFTHAPKDIGRMIQAMQGNDLALGSRYMEKGSLSEWNPFRKSLTIFAHFLTRTVLGLTEDASGAFRVYNLERIPISTFKIMTATSYSFFFESLFILRKNGFTANQIPIHLSARTYGSSKMSFREAFRSFRFLISLFLANLICPEQFLIGKQKIIVKPGVVDVQGWDSYWNKRANVSGWVYQVIASLYRRAVIRPNLQYWMRRSIAHGTRTLHAGCGSGNVDRDLHGDWKITAVDISLPALQQYIVNNPNVASVEHCSIFDLPFERESFDAIYNLGVMEHFTPSEIRLILDEFHRILKPDGKVLLFWPHQLSTSVNVLKIVHRILKIRSKEFTPLHPPELTYIQSFTQAEGLLCGELFEMESYYFGPRDLWVQAVIVLKRKATGIITN